METLWQDLRYGLRLLWKNRGFTAIALLALALGIGANSAIFTIINAVLLRPLPYERPEQLVWVWGRWAQGNRASISPPDFLDYRAQAQSLDYFCAMLNNLGFNITGEGEPERIAGAMVTTDFFRMLGVKPALGRDFLSEEEKVANSQVVIISHGLWQRRYGGRPDIVGKQLTLDGKDVTVVGIMPASFRYFGQVDMWRPMTFETPNMQVRKAHFLRPIARLKAGVTITEAQAEIETIASRLSAQYPETNKDWSLTFVPLQELFTSNVRLALLVLLGAVTFLLLIACANIANLLLARAAVRKKELAIRAALGAGRLRLLRQLLTESLVLAGAGGLLGVLFSYWGIDLLVNLIPPNIPRLSEINIDGRVLAFTLGVSLITGLLCGILPALQASRPELDEFLKDGMRATEGRTHYTRNILVVAEIALSLILLVGAGLMARSFVSLQRVDPGFNTANLLTFRVELPQSKYKERPQRKEFYQQAIARIGALSGVESVSTVTELPLTGQNGDTYFVVEGREPASPSDKAVANLRGVQHDYFRAMGIPLMKGRYFTSQDEEKIQTVIINEAMASTYLPGEDPIGKRIKVDLGEQVVCEVVGVVGNIKHYTLTGALPAEMYLPFANSPSINVVVRASGEPLQLMAPIRKEIQQLDKDLPVASVRTMDEIVERSTSQERFRTFLFTIFAVLALLLAAVGIYSVLSYSITQRTREIGIRMALGAQPRDMLKMVMRYGATLTLIGLAIGLAGAFALTRVISGLLFNVSATDPLTFTAITLLLALSALAATYFPARRATKVDPIISLRQD